MGRAKTTLTPLNAWAAQYNTWLFIKLMPKGVVFSILFCRSAIGMTSHAMTCKLTSEVYCAADDSLQPAPAIKLPEEESNEPGPSRLQQEADKPAAKPLAVKAKKQKRKHSKLSPSDADVQAVESPAGTMVAADAPAQEAAVASQMVQEPVEAVSQDATTEPEQMKEKKKKKKKRQIEDVATGSQPDSAENAAVPAVAVVQDQPELVVTEEPSVQTDGVEPSDKLKKKKKKKKRHSDADVDAQQPAAVSAAVVEPELNSAQAEPAQAAQEPDVKPKKKKKKHRQDASVEPRPAGTTAVDTTAAAAEVESAPETELQQADVAASTAAEVKPKKRKHKDSASKSKQPSAADDNQADAVEAGAPQAEAQGPEQPAVKPKRKRKSKVDATAAAEAAAAEAPSDVPAAAAAAQTPKAKKATAALAKKSSCSTLPVLNSWRANQARTDVKKGKFTKQEKDTLKQAAQTYVQDNGLPSDDFSWLLNKARTSGNRKDVNGAWQTIAQSLPHRTYKSVYACGSRMLSELNYQVRQRLDLQTPTSVHSAMTKRSACTIQAFVAWQFGRQTLLAYFLQPMTACCGY